MMNEIESAKFSFDFIYKPKPGPLKQNKTLIEQDLNIGMQQLNLQAPYVFNSKHMEYLTLKINSINQT